MPPAAAASAAAAPPMKLTLKAPKLLIKGPWGQPGPSPTAAAGPPPSNKLKKKKKRVVPAGPQSVQLAGPPAMRAATAAGQVCARFPQDLPMSDGSVNNSFAVSKLASLDLTLLN